MFNNNVVQTGSLFGGNPTPTATTAAGGGSTLFSNTSGAPTATTGLFGNFGAGAAATTPATGTGATPAPAATTAVGGFFNITPTAGTTGGATGTAQPSLFGGVAATTTTTGGPAIPQKPSTTTTTPGLFGPKDAPNPAPTGGLFSGNAAGTTTTTTGGGMFSGNTAAPTATTTTPPAPTAATGGGIFSNTPAATGTTPAPTAPAGANSLFGVSTPAPASTTPAATTGGIFGGGSSTTAPKPEEKKRDAETELLMNNYLSSVLNKWKDVMKDQVEEFQKVAVDIRKNEAELIKNHQLIYNVHTVHQSVKDEYKTLDTHLTKLEKDQEIIEAQLSQFSNELERLVKAQTHTDPRSSGSLLEKCRGLNERMSRVDSEVDGMIQSMNTSSHAPEKVDPQQVPVNVSLVLNNYFYTLQNLELETLSTRRRLEELCRRNNYI